MSKTTIFADGIHIDRLGEIIDSLMTVNKDYPQIIIEDFDFYDINIFNKCESLNKILVTNEIWHRAHPLLHTISVDWKFDMPYGLLYSTKPSPKVKCFLQIIEDSILK